MPFEKIIHKELQLQASVAQTWEALTRPESIKAWLWDEAVDVISDWTAGSTIIFAGTFNGKPYRDKGRLLVFEPEKNFTYTYLSGISKLPDEAENYTVIEFRLAATDTGTILTLNQSNFVTPEIYHHWNFYWNVTLASFRKFAEKR